MEYAGRLEKAAEFLDCLEACGVDNWRGYAEAVEMMEELNEGLED